MCKHVAELSAFKIKNNSVIVTDGGSVDGGGTLRGHLYAAPGTHFIHESNGVMTLIHGDLFLNSRNCLPIKTPLAQVLPGKGALASITTHKGRTYIRSCGPTGTLSVIVNARRIPVNSGEELLICDHEPEHADISPADGVGRRNTHTTRYGAVYATVSDFSIISAVSNHQKLATLCRSSNISERRLLERLLKTAATIDTVLKHRGPYKTN